MLSNDTSSGDNSPETQDTNPTPPSVPTGGYYTGIISSDVTLATTTVEVIVGANHVIYAYDRINRRKSFWGSLAATDSGIASNVTVNLSAELWNEDYVFPDGSSTGYVDVIADFSDQSNVTGTYRGAADSGKVEMTYVPQLAERESSLQEISGVWQKSDDDNSSSTLMVDDAGNLEYSNTDGCTGRGEIVVLDPALNGYEFHIDWNCLNNQDPAWNGPGEGLAFVDDYNEPGVQWLVFAESIWTGRSDVWSLERPAPMPQTADSTVGESLLAPDRVGRWQR